MTVFFNCKRDKKERKNLLGIEGKDMKYEEAMEYIEECNSLGSVLGLESMERLMKELQNPQNELTFIHVAGTNG